MAFSLQDALEQIHSDRVKDRQQGLEALEHIFSDSENVLNLDPRQDGKPWLKTFQSLFACVLAEKAACIRKGSFLDAQPVALARLQRAAQLLRTLVEKSASLLTRKVVKALLVHILQMLNHRGSLLRPVAPAYISALCALLKHQHHVDHLDPDDWWAAASLCFNILLARDLDGTVSKGSEEWLAFLSAPAPNNAQGRGLSLEDAVTAECLRYLMGCTVAPFLGRDGRGLQLLGDYTQFLLAFPKESSTHLPAMAGLVVLLEHLELNHTREVISASLALQSTLLSLWKTKNQLLKVQVLLAFRILVPLLAACATGKFELGLPQDQSAHPSLRTEAINFLLLVHDALLHDPNTRWALEPVRIDALIFQWPLDVEAGRFDPRLVLSNRAFFIGPYSNDQDTVAWCRVSLQVDIVEALVGLDGQQQETSETHGHVTPDDEPASATVSREPSTPHMRVSTGKRGPVSTSSSPQKRRKTRSANTAEGETQPDCLEDLIRMVADTDSSISPGGATRLYAMQLLAFILLTRPGLLSRKLIENLQKPLLLLTADTDSTLVSWSLIALGSIMLMHGTANTQGDVSTTSKLSTDSSDVALSIAIRKLQLSETCRAAAFLLTAMLAKEVLSDTKLQPEIFRMLAEVDLQGPLVLCDTVCHLMTLILQRTTSSRTYLHMDPRRKVGAWLASTYKPADAFYAPITNANGRTPSLFVPFHDLLRLMTCIVADGEPDHYPGLVLLNTRNFNNDVTQLLQRRARTQPLRDLALRACIGDSRVAEAIGKPASTEGGASLLSMEAFNRMTVILDMKVGACFDALNTLSAGSAVQQYISCQAMISALHTGILGLHLWSHPEPQNSTQRTARLRRCCQVINKIVDIASKSLGTTSGGRSFVLRQLYLLSPSKPWVSRSGAASDDLLYRPGVASGVPIYAANSSHNKARSDSLAAKEATKRLWKSIREADMLEVMLSSCDQLLKRALFGDDDDVNIGSTATASTRDALDGMQESECSGSEHTRGAVPSFSIESTESVVSVAVRLLCDIPRLLTGSVDSRRNELVISRFFECPVEGLVLLSPVLFDSLSDGTLWMSQRDLVDALDRIGTELLTSYHFARQPVARLAAVRAVSAVVPILLKEFEEHSDLYDKVQKLAAFFADQIGRTKWPTPSEVQLACANFLADCLRKDPEGRLSRSGSARGASFSPLAALLRLNIDADIRVRGLGSSIAASVFETISNDEPHMSEVYTEFREGLPSDSNNPQHILTRALSLCNVAIASSSVRQSTLFHLLEIVLATSMFPLTIQHLFAQVAARLGFVDAARCYQAFAAQITWGMATNSYDPLQVPWKVLGFSSKRECLDASFAACGSMLLAAQTSEGRTQFDTLVRLTRRTRSQGLQECLPFLTAAYLGFAVQASQQAGTGTSDLPGICQQTLHELSLLGFAESDDPSVQQQMIRNADDLVITTLLMLYYEPAATLTESRSFAIASLKQQDAKCAMTLSALTPSTNSTESALHEPSRPFFPAAVICTALSALPNLGIEPFRKDTTYNVLRHMIHHISASRFINDQLRLCAALRIYIAMCGDDFWSDHLNAPLLIQSITELLDQSHLHSDFKPILAYACTQTSLAARHPDVLVSCIVTWSTKLGDCQSTKEGAWLLEASHTVSKVSSVATSATALLWPVELTSTGHVATESMIDIGTLSFVIEACPRMSLHLSSLLRIRTVLRKASRAELLTFCNSAAWKLLERMASCPVDPTDRFRGDSRSDVMSDIFESIMGVGETALLQQTPRSVAGQGDRIEAEAFLKVVDTSQFRNLAAAAILTIQQLAAHELPLESSYQAFDTLRNIAAFVRYPLTEVCTAKMPASTTEELERIRPGLSATILGTRVVAPEDLLDATLLDAAASSRQWICCISSMLCDLLASTQHQPIFRSVSTLVTTNTTAAKALFPILLLCFTTDDINPDPIEASCKSKKRSASRQSEPQGHLHSRQQCRAAAATHFARVLESSVSDPACSEIIIRALLALRRFRPVQQEPDKVCFWYEVDTSLLAKRCLACGLNSASIFFIEHGVWEQDESQTSTVSLARSRANLLHQAYTNIDDPDAFYGITDGDVRELLLRRLHHEGQWLRAFQYHAADYEASSSDRTNTDGPAAQSLGQSLSLLGFHHLFESVGSSMTSEIGTVAPLANGCRRDASSWDLPANSSSLFINSPGPDSVLHTLRQASAEQDVDIPLAFAFKSQLQSLCSTPVESISIIRKLQGDLLALGQVKDWRKASAALGPDEAVAHLRAIWTREDADYHFEVAEKVLSTRQSVLQAVRQRMQSCQIGDILDGPAENVARMERSLLVLISRQSREHEELQKAINATARAERIERALGDGANIAREEFAAVLWEQSEHSPAIKLLAQIVDELNVTAQSAVQQKHRGARLLALLAQWRATARSQHPREIDGSLFEPALKLIASSTASDVTAEPSAAAEQSNIAYRWARFAEQHHRGSDITEITRLRLYIDRRQEEIAQNQRECERTSSKTERNKLLQFQRQAEKIIRQDQARLTELEASRAHFLRRSIAMYARALASSDEHDDAVARLVSLWFENAADEDINRLQASCLASIPSRKFVPLMHQLSARLTEVPDKDDSMAPFQSTLSSLLTRMCQDHPFHCLYDIFALIKTGADAKAATQRPSPKSSSSTSASPSSSPSPQILRSIAAEKIWNHIKRRSALSKRIKTLEELCLAYVEWAEYDLTSRADRYFQSSGAIKKGALRMPPSGELRLARMRDLDVPVATSRLELDPTCRYETFVSIARYSETFTTAGGIHLPKISECIGSDGKRYKQLFKRDDDLRQDAVMQQVFRMVNELLGADRRTRERRLAIRTYTVLPLGPQCGLLEFVTNTVPLGEVLIGLHAKFRPTDLTPTQARSKLRDAQPLPAEAKLEAFLDVCESMRPAFRYFFSDAQRMPRDWYETRLRYTRSVSTNSIVGHVLGLGDRHVSNILLDKESGELVHIDFGVAFDQGKLLPIPELVPFRLTRDIVDGMGINGVEGTFRRCCEETLRVLRAHHDVIKTVLEVFRHDPLFAWTSNPIKVLRAQEADESSLPAPSMERSGSMAGTTRSTPAPTPTPLISRATGRMGTSRSVTPLGVAGEAGGIVGTDTAGLSADRAIASVMTKLSSSLSIEYTVNDLIQQAMDAGNLSAIFHGWQAAL